MKNKLKWLAAALLLLALTVWAFLPKPTDVELASVRQGRFERAVQEDGKTRVRERYVVSAPLTGQVQRISLRQGDTVVQGAVVAMLWPVAPTLLDARTRAEQGAHRDSLQAAFSRTQATTARAQAALEQARTELQRSEALAQQGFVSPTQNETGRLALRLREQEQLSARHDEDAARYNLAQATVALQNFASTPQDATPQAYAVRAPVAGRVLRVLQGSEGVTPAGAPLIELGDPGALEVVADLLTEDAAQITAGTPVQLAHWGGPTVLAGRVRLVEPGAFTKVSALGIEEQRVQAVIDITAPPAQWRALGDGFKVEVRVLVQVVEGATLVPVSALFPVGSRWGLFVFEQGRARLREVDVASRNGVDAWISSPLAPGTPVVVYPDSKLQDGARVKGR
jgi:HlyD family secretion protein